MYAVIIGSIDGTIACYTSQIGNIEIHTIVAGETMCEIAVLSNWTILDDGLSTIVNFIV